MQLCRCPTKKVLMFKSILGVALATLVAGVSLSALAQSAPPPNMPMHADFHERQSVEAARIQEHIAMAQAHLSCVQAAVNPEGLRACNQQFVQQSMPRH